LNNSGQQLFSYFSNNTIKLFKIFTCDVVCSVSCRQL